jgi:hypothetical protein
MSSLHLSRRRIATIFFGTLVAALMFGCGPGVKDRGTVKGKVTIGGKALNMGTVTFVTDDNRTGSATIKEDGSYEMHDAPVGECKISVSIALPSSGKMAAPGMMPPGGKMPGGGMPGTGMPGPGAPGGMGGKDKGAVKPPPGTIGGGDGQQMSAPPQADLSKAVRIPERYAQVDTSGLKFTVKKGEQTYDIPLTP